MNFEGFEFRYEIGLRPWIGHLLVEIEASRRAVERLMLPSPWTEDLDGLSRLRAIRGTTGLAGAPGAGSGAERAGAALDWLRGRFDPTRPPVGIADILHLHRLATEGEEGPGHRPGALRRRAKPDAFVGVDAPADQGAPARPGAPAGALPKLMQGFAVFASSGELRTEHPAVRGLLCHLFLTAIRPFAVGNGRVARLVETALLYEGGYGIPGFHGLSHYFHRHRDLHLRLLAEGHAARPLAATSFVEFGLRGCAAELRAIDACIKSRLNRLLYRDLMTRALSEKVSERRRLLSRREYLLLDHLLVQGEPGDPFAAEERVWTIRLSKLEASPFVRSGYRSVTRRTFLRELKRLQEVGFLFIEEGRDGGEPLVGLDYRVIARKRLGARAAS